MGFLKGGQMKLGESFVDCVIISQPHPTSILFSIFQFNGSFFHGHSFKCSKIGQFNQEQKFQNDLLIENTQQKEDKLRRYLEYIRQFYSNLNITMNYTIETEWECSLSKHKSPLHNVQSKWLNCSYSTFLNSIRQNQIKGIQ